MKTRLAVVFAALLAAFGPATTVDAQADAEPPPTGVVEAFRQGTTHLGFRYRYEFVDEDALVENSYASTLRTVLNFRTAPLHGFDFFIEAENVLEIGDDWYRDAGRGPRGNAVVGRPVVADPAGTDINQVIVRYRGYDTDARVGRQEINIADQRFVGAVGWRQHHQTFSAVNVVNSSLGALDIQYVYNNKVYRIFGDKQSTSNNFVNAAIDVGGANTLRLFGIFLDYEDQEFFRLSRNSYGIDFTGSRDLDNGMRFLYELQYARQNQAANNPLLVEANYAHLIGGFGFQQWLTARVGWELLGGSAADGQFQTPLATLHKFNGWADKFLSTPTDGLQDLYVQFDGRVSGVHWVAAYHDFTADSGGARYGSEFDWQVDYRAKWQQLFALKGAYYSADTFSSDTLKVWLWTEYTF